jgi:hypothetical protein
MGPCHQIATNWEAHDSNSYYCGEISIGRSAADHVLKAASVYGAVSWPRRKANVVMTENRSSLDGTWIVFVYAGPNVVQFVVLNAESNSFVPAVRLIFVLFSYFLLCLTSSPSLWFRNLIRCDRIRYIRTFS